MALCKTSCRPKPVYTVSCCSIPTILPAGYAFSVQYIHHYPPYLEVVFSVCNLRALHAAILKDSLKIPQSQRTAQPNTNFVIQTPILILMPLVAEQG